MDYLTKPTNREELRLLSVLFRKMFGVNHTQAFPVLEALERIPDVFPGTVVKIVQDKELPMNIPARCFPNEDGDFTIEIKESIYQGAYKKISEHTEATSVMKWHMYFCIKWDLHLFLIDNSKIVKLSHMRVWSSKLRLSLVK